MITIPITITVAHVRRVRLLHPELAEGFLLTYQPVIRQYLRQCIPEVIETILYELDDGITPGAPEEDDDHHQETTDAETGRRLPLEIGHFVEEVAHDGRGA